MFFSLFWVNSVKLVLIVNKFWLKLSTGVSLFISLLLDWSVTHFPMQTFAFGVQQHGHDKFKFFYPFWHKHVNSNILANKWDQHKLCPLTSNWICSPYHRVTQLWPIAKPPFLLPLSLTFGLLPSSHAMSSLKISLVFNTSYSKI